MRVRRLLVAITLAGCLIVPMTIAMGVPPVEAISATCGLAVTTTDTSGPLKATVTFDTACEVDVGSATVTGDERPPVGRLALSTPIPIPVTATHPDGSVETQWVNRIPVNVQSDTWARNQPVMISVAVTERTVATLTTSNSLTPLQTRTSGPDGLIRFNPTTPHLPGPVSWRVWIDGELVGGATVMVMPPATAGLSPGTVDVGGTVHITGANWSPGHVGIQLSVGGNLTVPVGESGTWSVEFTPGEPGTVIITVAQAGTIRELVLTVTGEPVVEPTPPPTTPPVGPTDPPIVEPTDPPVVEPTGGENDPPVNPPGTDPPVVVEPTPTVQPSPTQLVSVAPPMVITGDGGVLTVAQPPLVYPTVGGQPHVTPTVTPSPASTTSIKSTPSRSPTPSRQPSFPSTPRPSSSATPIPVGEERSDGFNWALLLIGAAGAVIVCTGIWVATRRHNEKE